MRTYFFLITLCFLMNSEVAFSQDAAKNSQPSLYYPAIEISKRLSDKLFTNKPQSHFNCPVLLNNPMSMPNGTSIALCDDAQLACVRYGLLVQKMKTAT